MPRCLRCRCIGNRSVRPGEGIRPTASSFIIEAGVNYLRAGSEKIWADGQDRPVFLVLQRGHRLMSFHLNILAHKSLQCDVPSQTFGETSIGSGSRYNSAGKESCFSHQQHIKPFINKRLKSQGGPVNPLDRRTGRACSTRDCPTRQPFGTGQGGVAVSGWKSSRVEHPWRFSATVSCGSACSRQDLWNANHRLPTPI